MCASISPIRNPSKQREIKKESLWSFENTHRSITFQNEFSKHYCTIHISVQILADGCFMVSYVNEYEIHPPCYEMEILHPLYFKAKNEHDDGILDGIIVDANPITFHMINCLLSDETCEYNNECRPFSQYCAQIMRALVELEF